MNQFSMRAFTLLEILLVVAALAVLVGSVVAAINPVQQLADARDSKRKADIDALANALVQYYAQHSAYPEGLVYNPGAQCGDDSYTSSFGVCGRGQDCASAHLESELVPNYITEIPQDPASGLEAGYSGYVAFQDGQHHVVICAPFAETRNISVNR